MDLQIFSADASGNITLFVATPVERNQYRSIALQLLNNPGLNGEQVAFIVPGSNTSWDGGFEMCGLEFCCNATRSFGLYLATLQKERQPRLNDDFTVKVNASGVKEIMTVSGNVKTKRVWVPLPPPLSVTPREMSVGTESIGCVQVELDGITHIVLNDIDFDDHLADLIHEILVKESNPPALGVLFYQSVKKSMIPLVYVRDVDSRFLEGSCGSGTAALACALSYQNPDGRYRYETKQPQGALSSETTIKDGRIASVTVDGIVDIGPVKTVVID